MTVFKSVTKAILLPAFLIGFSGCPNPCTNLPPEIAAVYNSSTKKVEITATDDKEVVSLSYAGADITSLDTDADPKVYSAVVDPVVGLETITAIDSDGASVEYELEVPAPNLPVINSISYTPASPNVNDEITLAVDASDADSILYDTDLDGDYDDTNKVAYSSLGKKTVSVKAVNADGEDIESKDVYVNGTGSFTLSATTVQHKHGPEAEITLTDTAAGTHDTVKWYLDGLYATTTAKGGTYGQNVDWVGDASPTFKQELYSGAVKVGEHSSLETITGLNSAPDHPECWDNDEYILVDSGDIVSYYLDMKDINNDTLTLETNYGVIDPGDVTITAYPDTKVWQVKIDTAGWGTDTRFIRHKAKDPEGLYSTEEEVTISTLGS